MKGFSFVISKSCCLNYSYVTSNKINFCTSNKINFGTSNKINFCTSNKIDLILYQLSTMHHHLQRISPMLKHRVYSSSAGKEVTSLRSEASKDSGTRVLFGLLGIIGLALLIALEVVSGVLKLNAFFWGFASVYIVAKCFLGNIMSRFAIPRHNNKLFSIGDIIQVGQLKGEVVDMGLITTSLLTEDNRCLVVLTYWLNRQDIVNISRAPSRAIGYDICLSIDNIEKTTEISEEIRNMMRSNSLIYLEQEQPFCYLSELDPLCATLSFGCKLKQVGDCEFGKADADILVESITIIKKHGATPVDYIKK